MTWGGFCDGWAGVATVMYFMPLSGDDPFRVSIVAVLAAQQVMLLTTLRLAKGES